MRCGLIELGSSGFSLTVDRADRIDLHRRHRHDLARTVAEQGALDAEAVMTATTHARELLYAARVAGCDRITVIGTELFRTAANGQEAAAHLARQIEHPVHVVPAAEQVSLGFRAAASRRSDGGQLAVVSLGGGSLSVAAGRPHARPRHLFSFDLGVRLLAPRVLEGDRLRTSQRVRLEHHLSGELAPAARALESLDSDDVLVAGGAVQALATVIHTARRAQVPDTTDGLRLDSADLGHLISRLGELPTASRLALGGMQAEYAAVLPLAATIMRQILRSLGIERATVTTARWSEEAVHELRQASRRVA